MTLAYERSPAKRLVLQVLLHEGQGGMETLAASLAEGLPNHGYRVATVYADPKRHMGNSLPTYRRLQIIRNSVSLLEPAIILSHSTLPNLYSRLVAPIGTPVVTVLHSATNEWTDKKILWAERLLQRKTEKVVAVSRKKAVEYEQIFPRFAGKIVTIPNGLKSSSLTPGEVNRAEHSFFLFASRLVPQKRPDLLIEAVATLRHRGLDISVIMAGEASEQHYANYLSKMVDNLGIADLVHLAGPRTDIIELMSKAIALVHPSMAEAHSLVLLEASAMGLPVVVSSDVAETIDARTVAATFCSGNAEDLADAIEYTYREMGSLKTKALLNSAEIRADYSAERLASKYSEMISRIVDDTAFPGRNDESEL